jgi:energy-coupling factor transport system permease protein
MTFIVYNKANNLASLSFAVKIIYALCLTAWILLIKSGTGQIILLFCLPAIGFYGSFKISEILKYLRLFLPVFVIIFLLHLFYHPGESLFQIWFLTATIKGMKAGLFNILRFLNFIFISILFLSSTSPAEFARAIVSCSRFIKTNFFQELALVFFIALRFLPAISRERSVVKTAMQARGAEFGGNLPQRINSEIKLFLPLFSRVFRQADDVAAALSLRSYRGVYFAGDRTRIKNTDIFLVISILVLTIIIIRL